MLHFKEMLHIDEELSSSNVTYLEILRRELKKSIETGFWIDKEYQDEIGYMHEVMYADGDYSMEGAVRRLIGRSAGYKYSLLECPGFSYRKKDVKKAAADFCRSNYMDYLPEQLQKEADKYRAKNRAEEEDDEDEDG